jgi:Zn-dependent peptidase ImmA (M78 family)/transcriptional regulator with XRE-family HTH domain
MNINGNRIRQIRELCGWTQEELAYRVGIKQPTLAQLESGTDRPSEKVLEAIASNTGVRPVFFEKLDLVDFPVGSLLFRAHSSITSRQRTEAFRYAQLLFELWEQFALAVNVLPVRLPSFSEDPVLAAKITRVEFGLSPDVPIPFIINLAEKSGIVVLAIPSALEKRDAFSVWAGTGARKPIIAISAGSPGDRVAWSVAHELGHLVMHHPIKAFAGDLEDQANRFAAELLLPEAGIRSELSTPLTFEKLAILKGKWRVSMQSLIRRAKDLAVINDRAYRYMFEQFNARGWKTVEPNPIPAEKPRALREMAELIYDKPLNFARMANDTGIEISRLRGIFDAHAQRSGETGNAGDKGRGNVISMIPRQRPLLPEDPKLNVRKG